MRLPFSWHCKGDPFLIKVASWTSKKYDWEELLAAYPAEIKKEHKPEQSGKTDFKPRLKPVPIGVLGEGERHVGLEEYLKKAYFWIREDQGLAHDLRQHTKSWYEFGHTPQKPNWEREVDEMCDWFERRQWGAVISR
jgi:hypothetical protein